MTVIVIVNCYFLTDTCVKKYKDDEMLFETIQTFQKGKCISLEKPLVVYMCSTN